MLGWGLVHPTREIVSFGFSPSCSDGRPEYDARYCELPGGPSSLHVAAAMAVVVLALLALWVARRHPSQVGPDADSAPA